MGTFENESRARPGALKMNRACELGRSETADPVLE